MDTENKKCLYDSFILPKLTFQTTYTLELIINKFENNVVRCLQYMERVEQ